jgi:hypothetical protein
MEEQGERIPEAGLRPLPERSPLTPVTAMAEALRANAEALRHVDASQRRLAEAVEKGERAQQVVASTRALNETFRGLAEIQRGLLEAVVRGTGRGGRGGAAAFVAIALLAGLLGFLAYERLRSDDAVPRDLYEAARSAAERTSLQLGEIRATFDEGRAREEALRADVDRVRAELALAEQAGTARQAEIDRLQVELETREERLRQYLSVKEMADTAGAVQVENLRLQTENRRLQEGLDRSEAERAWLLEQLGRYKMDARGGDPEAIRQKAEAMGVVKPPEPPLPEGTMPLDGTSLRVVKKSLNRLLGQAPGEEVYEILDARALEQGTTLLDVKVGRYRNQRLLNSLSCKRMEVAVHADRDTVELRFHDGSIANTATPREAIPLNEDGHSVFLRGAGVKAWLEDLADEVSPGPDGRLTWKTIPP